MTDAKSAWKIAKKILAVILSSILGIVLFFTLPWILLACGLTLLPNPPAPTVTYGEFPFEIVYELDGETITVNDVYVCEYAGIGIHEADGKYRKWNGYFKSSGEEKMILIDDGNLKIACSVGYPQYYMSDPSSSITSYVPYLYYIKHDEQRKTTLMGAPINDPIFEQYKIKLISWQLSDPIENSFE